MTSIANRTQPQDRPTVAGTIARLAPEIQRALPKGMDADRIARIALTAVRLDRNLQECSPESFAGALLTAAALGLEPGGPQGEAYLVAYKRECTLIVGYKGLAKLYWQHPLAQHLEAQAVHAKDDFDYAYGLDPFLRHKPAVGDRGPVVSYYAAAALKSGAKSFVVLSVDEVKALRANSRKGSIPDPMHWMERKTALRQLFKLLPSTTNMNAAIAADEKSGTELHRERVIETQSPAALEHAAAPAEPTDLGNAPEAVEGMGPAYADVVDGEVEDPPGWKE